MVCVLVLSIVAIGGARAQTAAADPAPGHGAWTQAADGNWDWTYTDADGAVHRYVFSPDSYDAFHNPTEIRQAISDVQSGTYTPGEYSEYQAVVDWMESEEGVQASNLTYPNIGFDINSQPVVGEWSPFYDQLSLGATQAAPATEDLVGGELLGAAAETGVVDSSALDGLGAICLDPAGGTEACAAVAAAAGVGLILGNTVTSIIGNDGTYADVTGNSAMSDTLGAIKVWQHVHNCSGGLGSLTVDKAMQPGNPDGFPADSGNPDNWGSAGYSPPDNVTNTGATDPTQYTSTKGELQGVPCGPGVDPGGGYYVLWLDLHKNYNYGPTGWLNYYFQGTGTQPCLGQYGYGPPSPGTLLTGSGPGSLPPQHGWGVFQTNHDPAYCYPPSDPTAAADGYPDASWGLSLRRLSAEKAKLPKPGTSCPSGYHCTTTTPHPMTCGTGAIIACLAHAIGATGGANTHLALWIDSMLNAPAPVDPNGGGGGGGGGNTCGPNGNTACPPGVVTVPNCVGLQPAGCKAALTTAGFTAAPVETTLTPAQSDLTKPAGAVVTTNPAGGAQVDPGTVVELDENPDPLPLAIPAPLPGGETYQAYIQRLQSLGFVGTITEVDLTPATSNPSLGPGDVVQTQPQAGTKAEPSTSITVYANPATNVGPTFGPPVGPTLPGINLPAAPTPCNVFPFGLPCWTANQLGGLASISPEAPRWQITTPHSITGGATLDIDPSNIFGFDFGSVMSVVRPILLFLSFIGLFMWLGGMAMGGSTGGGGSAEEAEG